MTAEASTQERLARMEGAHEHLATKADIQAVKADMERLRGDTRLQTAIVVAVQIVAFLILRFLP